jgi:argininosuccinate synthase
MKQLKLRSFGDLDILARSTRKVITLFSGGLDSSYLLMELAQRGFQVTALAVDLGDGAELADLKLVTDHFGAELLRVDARQAFVADAVLPAIRAQARYLGTYPISSSLSRPVLAKVAVEQAQRLGCNLILHTANQSQNSLRRLNGSISQLGFEGWYGSPYEFGALPRETKIRLLAAAGLPNFRARGVSIDANLWCREFESGALDNPEAFWVPESLFVWTSPRSAKPASPSLSLQFEAGVPVGMNGQRMAPAALIADLNRRAGAYGVGRYSGLEHLEQGEKVLEVREAPAATVLMQAYRHLETATLDAELIRAKLAQEQVWVREAIEGRWYGGLRQATDAFIGSTAQAVTGSVHFRLRPGAADLCGIRADRPLYLTDRDTWERDVAQLRSRTCVDVDEADLLALPCVAAEAA